ARRRQVKRTDLDNREFLPSARVYSRCALGVLPRIVPTSAAAQTPPVLDDPRGRRWSAGASSGAAPPTSRMKDPSVGPPVPPRSWPDRMTEVILRVAPVLCRAVAYLVALLVTAPLVYHLIRGSPAYLGLLEDDYFYYSIVADKLLATGKLTYDGITTTNGFH